MHDIKYITRFSAPFIAMLTIQKSLQWMSIMLLGLLGTKSLAAGALVFSSYLIFIMIGTGTLNVLGIRIAESVEETLDVTQQVYHGFYVSVCIALVSSGIIFCLPDFWLWVGEEQEIVSLGKKLLFALAYGFPAVLCFSVLREFSAALNQQKMIAYLSFYAIFVHVIYNSFFWFSMHSIAGVGYASAMTEWTMVFLLIYIISRNTVLNHYKIFKGKFNKETIIDILKIGLPSGITLSLEVIMSATLTMMMGYFGVEALAAHQIAFQCLSFVYLFPLGLSLALGLIIGQRRGSQHAYKSTQLLSVCVVGFLFSVVVLVLFLYIPGFFIHFFIHPSDWHYDSVKKLAISFLTLVAFINVFDTQQAILMGALRGYKDTLIPMVIVLCVYLIAVVLGGYCFAFVLKCKGIGLWYGLALGLMVSTFLLSCRWYQKNH